MPQRRTVRITPEAIELFKRGCEIQATGDAERWEERGGRRAEFIQLDKELNRLLARTWCPSLFDVELDRKRPPAYLRPDHQLYRDWFPAQQLRRALLDELEYTERRPDRLKEGRQI